MNVPPTDRFSRSIDLRKLERQSHRFLWAGFLFSVLFHAGLAVFLPFCATVPQKTQREQYRTILTDIIEVPSQKYNEPFQMEAQNRVRNLLRRGFTPATPPAMPIQSGKRPISARKATEIPYLPNIEAEGNSMGQRISEDLRIENALPREPDYHIPLSRDIGSDPGEFQTDIVYNPEDKTAAHGYIHIPLFRFQFIDQTEMYRRCLRGLTRGVSRASNITAAYDKPLLSVKSFHRTRLLKAERERGIDLQSLPEYPTRFVYLFTDQPDKISQAEKDALSQYVQSCRGMLFLENPKPGNAALRKQLHDLLAEICPSLPIQPIPRDHPIYHCYYDFPDGPPAGAGQELGAVTHEVQPYLEGVWIEDRLVAVFSDFGYSLCWAAEQEYQQQIRMGVNLVLHAFTPQMGTLGHRAASLKKPVSP